MDIKKIKKIIELFEDTTLNELSLEVDDIKIGMKKDRGQYIQEIPMNTKTIIKEEVIEEKENLGNWVKAPFVGTFYEAPSQTSEPFIKIGQIVNVGDTLCILEAMKVMNEIKASHSGVVLDIKVKDGNMVEFGEEMILIGE